MAKSPKGRAIIEVLLDSNKLNKQLKRVEDNFKRVGANVVRAGAGFTAFGAALVAPLIIASKAFVDFGDTVDKIAARTGASAEFISALGFAAEQSGADIKTLEKAIIGQQRSLNDMNQGLKTAADAYGALGLTAKDFEGLNTEQSFTKIAQALSEVEDPSLRAATAMEIFGKAGQKLIPLLNGGQKAIAAFTAEAKAAGLVISPEDAKQAAILADALNKAQRALKGLQFKIGASLASQFTTIVDALTEYIVKGQEFIDKNKGLVKSALALGAGIAGIGAILTGLGISAILLGATIGSLTTIVSAVAGAFSLAAGAAVTFWTSFLAPLTGVTILVGVLLNQIVDLKAVFIDVGKSIKSDFGGAIESAKGNLDLLKRAVAAGDLKLAFQILAKSAELFFRQSFSSITGLWDGLVGDFLLGINKVYTAWQRFILNVDALFINLEIAGSSAVDTLVNTFSKASSTLNIIFVGVLSEIQMLWLSIKALFKAGLKVKEGDISGVREVFRDLDDQKELIKKSAEAKINAELKLSFEGDSLKTELLKKSLAGNDQLFNEALKESAKQEIKIITDLEAKTKAQDLRIDELIDDLKFLGVAVNRAEADLLKRQEDKEKELDDKGTIKAIKSIAPQFGSLVETGSSDAMRLFASNQNPMVKEQQKTNKALGIIADNTAGLITV